MNTSHTRIVIRPFITLLLGKAGGRWLKKAWEWSFIGLALLAITLGYWGFTSHGNLTCQTVSGWEAALKTVQLFVLESSWGDLCSWHTQVAAFAAPLATVRGVLAAFGPRIKRWLEVQVLRLSPASDVFIGGGALATGVAISLDEGSSADHPGDADEPAPSLLVGLDLQGETSLALVMESFRVPCFVRQGDGLSSQDLRALQLHGTRRIWIATGDDHRNLEVARRVLKLFEPTDRCQDSGGVQPVDKPKAARQDKPIHLLVSVHDHDLVRAKKFMYENPETSPATVDFFSLPRLAARVLWRRHPPPLSVGSASPHILIVGTSELAASLLVYAAQHGVYNDRADNCIRITVVGPSASGFHERLLRQFPALAPDSPDLMLKPLLPLAHIQTLDTDEDKLSQAQWQKLQSQQDFSVVYVACERDLDTVSAAIQMASLRELDDSVQSGAMPIVACIQQPRGSLCSVSPGGLRKHKWLKFFEVYTECIHQGEAYPGAQQDRWAMLVKAAYAHGNEEAPFKATSESLKQARAEWLNESNEDFRWSNRLAADHISLKLDLVAERSSPDQRSLQDWRVRLKAGEGAELADELEAILKGKETLDWLSRLEHRRFVADRLMGGWLPLPSNRRGAGASDLKTEDQKQELRLNHTLVPFDTLEDRANQSEEDERKKDNRIVMVILEVLRSAAMRPTN